MRGSSVRASLAAVLEVLAGSVPPGIKHCFYRLASQGGDLHWLEVATSSASQIRLTDASLVLTNRTGSNRVQHDTRDNDRAKAHEDAPSWPVERRTRRIREGRRCVRRGARVHARGGRCAAWYSRLSTAANQAFCGGGGTFVGACCPR